MATRRLARTALDEGVTNALSARGVNTAKELFEHTPLDLSEMLDISVADANRIVLTVAAEVRPEGSDALSLLIKRRSQPTHLHFGLLPLDEALRGGVPAGSVTEVVGPAGAGKTQVCFTLLVNAFRLGGSTVYIDTEARFSASRVVEIARAKWGTDFATDASLEALTRSVVLFTPTTSSELLARLESLEAVIIERAAKLVIVDSVAALVRADGGSLAGGASSREGREARAATLGAQATRLKQLRVFPLIVVFPYLFGGIFDTSSQAGGGVPHPRSGDQPGDDAPRPAAWLLPSTARHPNQRRCRRRQRRRECGCAAGGCVGHKVGPRREHAAVPGGGWRHGRAAPHHRQKRRRPRAVVSLLHRCSRASAERAGAGCEQFGSDRRARRGRGESGVGGRSRRVRRAVTGMGGRAGSGGGEWGRCELGLRTE